jgi:hypothetical protein
MAIGYIQPELMQKNGHFFKGRYDPYEEALMVEMRWNKRNNSDGFHSIESLNMVACVSSLFEIKR